MTKLCVKGWNEIFVFLKFVIVWEPITESQVLATRRKTREDITIYRPNLQMTVYTYMSIQ